jgi:hypothetical protein
MIKNITIAILLIIVFLFFKDKSSYIGQPSVIVDTDTVYQQKTFTKFIKGKSIPFVVLDTTYIIDQVHDTITIVKDYNQVKVYSDTMRIDSFGYAYIQDTISQNKIQGRSFKAEISEKTIYVTKTITPKPKNALYLGITSDLRQDKSIQGVGIGLMLKVKDKSLIGLGFDSNKFIKTSFYFKL